MRSEFGVGNGFPFSLILCTTLGKGNGMFLWCWNLHVVPAGRQAKREIERQGKGKSSALRKSFKDKRFSVFNYSLSCYEKLSLFVIE